MVSLSGFCVVLPRPVTVEELEDGTRSRLDMEYEENMVPPLDREVCWKANQKAWGNLVKNLEDVLSGDIRDNISMPIVYLKDSDKYVGISTSRWKIGGTADENCQRLYGRPNQLIDRGLYETKAHGEDNSFLVADADLAPSYQDHASIVRGWVPADRSELKSVSDLLFDKLQQLVENGITSYGTVDNIAILWPWRLRRGRFKSAYGWDLGEIDNSLINNLGSVTGLGEECDVVGTASASPEPEEATVQPKEGATVPPPAPGVAIRKSDVSLPGPALCCVLSSGDNEHLEAAECPKFEDKATRVLCQYQPNRFAGDLREGASQVLELLDLAGMDQCRLTGILTDSPVWQTQATVLGDVADLIVGAINGDLRTVMGLIEAELLEYVMEGKVKHLEWVDSYNFSFAIEITWAVFSLVTMVGLYSVSVRNCCWIRRQTNSEANKRTERERRRAVVRAASRIRTEGGGPPLSTTGRNQRAGGRDIALMEPLSPVQ